MRDGDSGDGGLGVGLEGEDGRQDATDAEAGERRRSAGDDSGNGDEQQQRHRASWKQTADG